MKKFADLFTFSNYEFGAFYGCILIKEISPQLKIGDNIDCIKYLPENGTLQLYTYSQIFNLKIELIVTHIELDETS